MTGIIKLSTDRKTDTNMILSKDSQQCHVTQSESYGKHKVQECTQDIDFPKFC